MITMLCGVVGAGKTTFAVEHYIIPLAERGQHVYTNVPLLWGAVEKRLGDAARFVHALTGLGSNVMVDGAADPAPHPISTTKDAP